MAIPFPVTARDSRSRQGLDILPELDPANLEDTACPITFSMVTARYPNPPPLQLNASLRPKRHSMFTKSKPTSPSSMPVIRGDESAVLKPSDSASIAKPRRRARSAIGSADLGHETRVRDTAIDHDAAWSTWLSITASPEEDRIEALAAVRRWFGDRGLESFGLDATAGQGSKALCTPGKPFAFSAFADDTLSTKSSVPPTPVSPPNWTLASPLAARSKTPVKITRDSIYSDAWILGQAAHKASHRSRDENPRGLRAIERQRTFNPPPAANDWELDLMDRWSDLRHDLKRQWSRLPAEARVSKRYREAGVATRTTAAEHEEVPPVPRIDWDLTRSPTARVPRPRPRPRLSSSNVDDAIVYSPHRGTGIHQTPEAEASLDSTWPSPQALSTSTPLRSPRSLKRLAQRASRSLRNVKSLGSFSSKKGKRHRPPSPSLLPSRIEL